jgi:hypothetical protein
MAPLARGVLLRSSILAIDAIRRQGNEDPIVYLSQSLFCSAFQQSNPLQFFMFAIRCLGTATLILHIVGFVDI